MGFAKTVLRCCPLSAFKHQPFRTRDETVECSAPASRAKIKSTNFISLPPLGTSRLRSSNHRPAVERSAYKSISHHNNLQPPPRQRITKRHRRRVLPVLRWSTPGSRDMISECGRTMCLMVRNLNQYPMVGHCNFLCGSFSFLCEQGKTRPLFKQDMMGGLHSLMNISHSKHF